MISALLLIAALPSWSWESSAPGQPFPPRAEVVRAAQIREVDDRLAVVAQRLDAAIAGTVTEERRATKLIVYPRSARLNPPRGGDLIVLLASPGSVEDEPVELPETAKLSVGGRPCRDTYLAWWFRMADDPRVELDRATDRYGIVTAARFRDAALARPVARPAARAVRHAAPPVYVAPRAVQVARPAFYYAAPVASCANGQCAAPQGRGLLKFNFFGGGRP